MFVRDPREGREMSQEGSSVSVIRGWGCTPTGDPPPAAVPTDQRDKKTCLPTIFQRGWRRNALYGIILFLMLLVFLNIALTLWVISALRLNMDGIGPLKIVNGGIQLDGQSWVLGTLVASTITSQPGQPLTLHSHRNFSVLVSGPNRSEQSKFVMKRDNILFGGRTFEVHDSRGGSVFRASREEVKVFADTFAVEGAGGLTVRGAVEASLVRAPPAADLQLESLTRKLELRAPKSIYLESRAGNIDVNAHGDIRLDSTVGAIKIDASNLIIGNLKEANTTSTPDKSQKNLKNRKVYQLCVCSSGKLFLAAPEAPCSVSDDDELCR